MPHQPQRSCRWQRPDTARDAVRRLRDLLLEHSKIRQGVHDAKEVACPACRKTGHRRDVDSSPWWRRPGHRGRYERLRCAPALRGLAVLRRIRRRRSVPEPVRGASEAGRERLSISHDRAQNQIPIDSKLLCCLNEHSKVSQAVRCSALKFSRLGQTHLPNPARPGGRAGFITLNTPSEVVRNAVQHCANTMRYFVKLA